MERGIRYDPLVHAASLGLDVSYARLRDGRKGEYRHAEHRILLRSGLSHRQQRCTLAHEVQHAVAGDVRSLFGLVNARQESRADKRAAAMLIDVDEYRFAESAHGPHLGALAEELDVTLHMLAVWRRTSGLLVSA